MPMTFEPFIKSLNIDFSKYELKPGYFDQSDGIHGIQHTYRVMMNVLKLGHALSFMPHIEHRTRLAFAGAFIHDMARVDNGEDIYHGLWAAKSKIHLLDFEGADLREIQTAVYNHCEPDFTSDHPHYMTTAMLKDADLLDRVRLGTPETLRFRFHHSKELQEFAKSLLKVKMSIDVFKNLIPRDTK